MNTLTTIYLEGSLGRRFGRKWELDVKSPAEAVRAIDINLKGELSKYLRGPAQNKYYKFALQKKKNIINAEEVINRSGNSTIYIVPTIKGSNSGVGKIIAGVVILALAWWNPMGWAYATSVAASGAVATSFTLAGTIAIGFGASLILGGISQLLTPTAKFSNSTQQQQSTSFPGNATTVTQGNCVPVVYGRMLVPAVPVSITVTNNDVGTTQVGYIGGNGATIGGAGLGGVGITDLAGGGVQYVPIDPNP